MDKKVISFFSFGFFLIVVGIVGRFAKWDQAMVVMAIGLVFELLAVVIYAWKKIKNR